MTELSTQKPLITEVFIDGARRGWDLATKSMLPNLVMAFVLIKVLTVSGLLNYIGMAFEPIILPSIFIMGGQLQYMGRCLGVIGIKDHMLYVIMLIPIVLAFATLAVMSVLI